VIGIVVIALAGKGKVDLPHLGHGATTAAYVLAAPAILGAHLAHDAARVALAVTLPPGHVHDWRCNEYLGVHAGVALAPRPALELVGAPPRANLLALSATLVDNRTGRILWMAAQPMPIDPVDEEEVGFAVAHLLSPLPYARN
jgi:hypothetical protein